MTRAPVRQRRQQGVGDGGGHGVGDLRPARPVEVRRARGQCREVGADRPDVVTHARQPVRRRAADATGPNAATAARRGPTPGPTPAALHAAVSRHTVDHSRLSTAHDSATTVSAALIPKATASADRSAGSATPARRGPATRSPRTPPAARGAPAPRRRARHRRRPSTSPRGLLQRRDALVGRRRARGVGEQHRPHRARRCAAAEGGVVRGVAEQHGTEHREQAQRHQRPRDEILEAVRPAPGQQRRARRRVRVRRMHRESPKQRAALPCRRPHGAACARRSAGPFGAAGPPVVRGHDGEAGGGERVGEGARCGEEDVVVAVDLDDLGRREARGPGASGGSAARRCRAG